MNTKQQAAQAIVNFLASNARTLFLNGTHQNNKHALALAAVFFRSPAPATVLFRANSTQNADLFLKAAGVEHKPKPGAATPVNGHSLHVDTINERSWMKSPHAVDVAVVYPVDSLDVDSGVACVHDLNLRGAKKIILVTWTDNKDFSWVDQFDPIRVTYDVEDENPDYHAHMKKLGSENKVEAKPTKVPSYAASASTQHLVRLHCDRCGATRWALLNKPYPGHATLRTAKYGEYTASCLKCGAEHDDNYNWYGR